MKISVVIPSIGNRNLFPTLRSIVDSSIYVDEIIISIPDQVNVNKDRFVYYINDFNNLKNNNKEVKFVIQTHDELSEKLQ